MHVPLDALGSLFHREQRDALRPGLPPVHLDDFLEIVRQSFGVGDLIERDQRVRFRLPEPVEQVTDADLMVGAARLADQVGARPVDHLPVFRHPPPVGHDRPAEFQDRVISGLGRDHHGGRVAGQRALLDHGGFEVGFAAAGRADDLEMLGLGVGRVGAAPCGGEFGS
jgi:hypothetical protein